MTRALSVLLCFIALAARGVDGCLARINGTTSIFAGAAFSGTDGYICVTNGSTTVGAGGGSGTGGYCAVSGGTTINSSGPCTAVELLPTGKKFWYNATDLSSTPVSDWVDRISGYHWTASGSARPAWSASGVTFNGSSTVMGATNGTMLETDSAFLFVFKLNSTTASQLLLGNVFSGGEVILLISVNDYFYNGIFGNSAIGPLGTSTKDLISVKTTAAPRYDTYTNGITGFNSTTYFNQANLTRVGSGNGNAFASYILKEMIYWTNVGIWSATTVSNVHYYATNTWTYSP